MRAYNENDTNAAQRVIGSLGTSHESPMRKIPEQHNKKEKISKRLCLLEIVECCEAKTRNFFNLKLSGEDLICIFNLES